MYQAVTQAFTENNVGQGAAISVLLFVIILVFSLVQRAALRERAGY
jgi:multiple sugar transport system permease protein